MLERFAEILDTVEIRGRELPIVDKHGASHKRGPSKWQQRRYQMRRNMQAAEKQYKWDKADEWRQAIQTFENTTFSFDFSDVRPPEPNRPWSADSSHLLLSGQPSPEPKFS